MTTRLAISLILVIGLLGAAAIYQTNRIYHTSPELIAAEASQPYDCEPVVKTWDRSDACTRRWDAAWDAMRKAQATLDQKRDEQQNLFAGMCVALISMVTLAWLFRTIPRVWSYVKTKYAAWKSARRAAKVALLADAIKLAQGDTK